MLRKKIHKITTQLCHPDKKNTLFCAESGGFSALISRRTDYMTSTDLLPEGRVDSETLDPAALDEFPLLKLFIKTLTGQVIAISIPADPSTTILGLKQRIESVQGDVEQ